MGRKTAIGWAVLAAVGALLYYLGNESLHLRDAPVFVIVTVVIAAFLTGLMWWLDEAAQPG